MSHIERHIPLDAPLIEGLAAPHCIASVIIPACNEEVHLARTLDALRLQTTRGGFPLDPRSYEIILLLNNCTDESEQVAVSYAQRYPELQIYIISRQLPPEQAHVGTARRLLMDTAYARLQHCAHPHCAILSTDGDTMVAPDWIACNMAAIRAGADVVGGVIHLFPDEMERLAQVEPETIEAYRRDRSFQARVARLESLLDPDGCDPWPRHLEHFGASLACTPAIYALSGGLPPVKPLEDVAFVDALRKVGARIRHCPETHIFTSARLHGRAEVGLSGQLRHWKNDAEEGRTQLVDSANWLSHRFRTLELLRRLNESLRAPNALEFPEEWRDRLREVHSERLPTARFLEVLDCDRLIEEMFVPLEQDRFSPIELTLLELELAISSCEAAALIPA